MSAPHSKTILVVDDNPLDLQFAGGIITGQTGYRVVYARDGVQAMELMQCEKPDLVLTDLQMPEIDGLALVEGLRQRYPFVPAVLMTAFGSEEIAVEALQKGAASYVPKKELRRRLVDTLRGVLAAADGHQRHEKVKTCWQGTHFKFCIDNDDAVIPVLVSHVQQYAAAMCDDDETESFRLGVALHEALRNAIEHGNLELNSRLRADGSDEYYEMAQRRRREPPFCHRRVWIEAYESGDVSRYVIRDEGPGFDRTLVNYDPCDPANIAKPSGRGLFLIHTFMDEVAFNDTGNEITMTRRRKSPRGDAPHARAPRSWQAQQAIQ
ncbi:MAG: response regulator [Pirellulaceae bacterium]